MKAGGVRHQIASHMGPAYRGSHGQTPLVHVERLVHFLVLLKVRRELEKQVKSKFLNRTGQITQLISFPSTEIVTSERCASTMNRARQSYADDKINGKTRELLLYYASGRPHP